MSVATVSRVINNPEMVKEKTKNTIFEVMKELNYIPSDIARSLSKSETNTIGVMIPDIDNPFYGKVIKGISSIADKEDLYMLLCDTDENQEKEMKLLDMLARQRIRGLIITPTINNNEYSPVYLSALSKLNVPIVLLDYDVKCSNFDGVFLDNIDGAYQAVECLINEGHKKIAIIAGPTTSLLARDRLNGYKKALVMNGIEIDEDYIFYGNFRLDSGYELTKHILDMEELPTAIFVSNDIMNLGCIKALSERNMKVPDDIALIGYDVVGIADVIGISVVDRPMAEMGKQAMNILMDRLKCANTQDKSVKRILLNPTLKLRGSEKKIK